ncbi:MAG TPA: penicillin-binding transpeptidase domain-containing protein [Polyangiaceae bacterium]|nr:penicillin-binding transpeptidase domain-containing protein [Polyangiaceae bacterium]
MGPAAAVSLALRAALCFGSALAVVAVLRRSSATTRRLGLLLAFGAVLGLPFVDLAVAWRPLARVVPVNATVRIVAEALVGPVPHGVAPSLAVSTPSHAGTAEVWRVLVFVWLSGAALLLLRLALGLARIRRWVRKAERVDATVSVSEAVDTPVVVGLFAPRILLPPASRGWSDERRRTILLHELAHVRRRDGLALFVGQLACALHWFQPLAWLALRQLRRECEFAADEDVLRAGVRASSYAEHLLAVARAVTLPAPGLAMAGRPSELARRVEVLLERGAPRRRLARPVAAAVSAASVVAVVLLALAGRAPAAPAEHPEQPSDSRLQGIVTEEATRVRAAFAAERVVIVMLDAETGSTLALTDDHPERLLLPASTLKPLLVALALDAGAITPEQRFDCGDGRRSYGEQTLTDAAPYGSLDAAEILAVSSNIGASRIFDALGPARFASGMARFRLPAPRDLEAHSLKGAIASFGLGFGVTPLALARAYAVLARGGTDAAAGARPARVVGAVTATRVLSMLEGAVAGERATGKLARIAGVRVAGKTGTGDLGDHGANFVGIVPVERPRYVVLVSVSAPSDVTGATVAAPVFARVARRALGLPLDTE